MFRISDSFDMEFVENDEVTEPRLDDFETGGMVQLEESCILVEGDELHYSLQETRKHKSYKVLSLSLSCFLSLSLCIPSFSN